MKHSLKLTLTALLICSFATPQAQAMDYTRLFDSNTKKLIWALTAAALTFVGAPFYQEYKKSNEYSVYKQYQEYDKMRNDPSIVRPKQMTIDMQYLNKYLNKQLPIQQEAQLPIWNRIPEDPASALMSHMHLVAIPRIEYLDTLISTTQDDSPEKKTLLVEQALLRDWINEFTVRYKFKTNYLHKNKHLIQPIARAIAEDLRNYWNLVIGRTKMISQPISQ